MAEVRKKEKVEKYNIDELAVKNKKQDVKKDAKKNKTTKKKVEEEKKSLWVKFRIFCHGVKSEFLKVHWPSKKDMVRYSIATIFFIIFCAVFFWGINVIFALVQELFK